MDELELITDEEFGDEFSSAVKLLDYVRVHMWPAYEVERERLREMDCWFKGEQNHLEAPRGATKELRGLMELSKTPWLGLVVTSLAQAMFIDGFQSKKATGQETSYDKVWETWHANQMPKHQIAVHRAALGYGYSYVRVTPGRSPSGKPRAVIRGVSPKECLCLYDDPAVDEFPRLALQVKWERRAGVPTGAATLYVFDSKYKYTIRRDKEEGLQLVGLPEEHGSTVVPFVRYTNQLDLDGNAPGEIELNIRAAMRIDKTVYDRLVAQHSASWRQRIVSGLANYANSQEEANLKKLKLSADTWVVFEDPEVKVTDLAATPLEGYFAAKDEDVDDLASVTQLPAHVLRGSKLANMSADALAAASHPLTQKVYERQVSFGASHDAVLRLVAALEGYDDVAEDFTAHVTWQDMQIRSLAQAADALGKMATLLGVPKQALWRMIPGVTQLDVEHWEKTLLDEQDPINKKWESMVPPPAIKAGGGNQSGSSSPADAKADRPNSASDGNGSQNNPNG